MKAAAVVMGVVLGLAILTALHQGRLGDGMRAAAGSAAQMAPIFVLAFLLMGFMEVLLPKGWVDHWLSVASGWRGLFVAWVAGILTPGGSAIGMPVAAGLTATGASPAVLVTYLTSMATLNVLRMPMEVAFYGTRLMVLRVVACLGACRDKAAGTMIGQGGSVHTTLHEQDLSGVSPGPVLPAAA